jgi:proteasome lid subunit RPN8/RPN11
VGIFHSHIHGPTDLSETDLKEWTYPEVVLLVWSRMEGDWQCRAFRLLGERPYEIPVVVQNE